jgi:aldose 1-epimerase
MRTIDEEVFGKLPTGQVVKQFTLRNRNGYEMKAINYGATITSFRMPNKQGIVEEVMLGFDTLEAYQTCSAYMGCVVGRFGNRIANGTFVLEGKKYEVVQNNNGQHLHGGTVGFDKVFWDAAIVASDEPSIKFTYVSVDGEEGYPGRVTVHVTYTLTDKNELKIEYQAQTDKTTVLNVTQHAYFNLVGNVKRDILDHELILRADAYLPTTDVMIPTGERQAVKGTPFDFTQRKRVGAQIEDDHQQLRWAQGYDQCWILAENNAMKHAATVFEETSGRYMDVYTTEPGVQFYTGNHIGSISGREGVIYKKRYGLCLETQHFPDSPNQPSFPTTVLKPNETFSSTTVYAFGVGA